MRRAHNALSPTGEGKALLALPRKREQKNQSEFSRRRSGSKLIKLDPDIRQGNLQNLGALPDATRAGASQLSRGLWVAIPPHPEVPAQRASKEGSSDVRASRRRPQASAPQHEEGLYDQMRLTLTLTLSPWKWERERPC